jgi:hypothetical protein
MHTGLSFCIFLEWCLFLSSDASSLVLLSIMITEKNFKLYIFNAARFLLYMLDV